MENLALPLLAIIGISLSAALLGVFVLWKKMAYFGDSLGHSSILGLALSGIFNYNLFLGFLIFAIIFALIFFTIDQKNLFSRDTILASISYGSMALGLILLALYPSSFDLEEYLLGNINSVSLDEVKLIYLVTALIILATIYWFKKLLLIIINEDLAIIEGVKTKKINLIFSLILALFIAISIKAIGIFLITAILILPAIIARNFSDSPNKIIFITPIISLLTCLAGFYFSNFFNLPLGASIISLLIFYLLAILLLKQALKKL